MKKLNKKNNKEIKTHHNINIHNNKNTNEENNDMEKKKMRTFTKKWVGIILSVSLIDIQMVFLLAFFGRDQIAETLGVAIVTEIIGVFISYAIKSYFESFASEKNKTDLEKERLKHEYNVLNNDNVIQDEVDVDVDDEIV